MLDIPSFYTYKIFKTIRIVKFFFLQNTIKIPGLENRDSQGKRIIKYVRKSKWHSVSKKGLFTAAVTFFLQVKL